MPAMQSLAGVLDACLVCTIGAFVSLWKERSDKVNIACSTQGVLLVCSMRGGAALQGVIGDIAESMCGSGEDPGDRHALRTILSQMTQYLEHEADGAFTIAQDPYGPRDVHALDHRSS